MTSLELLNDLQGTPLYEGFYTLNSACPGLESPLVCVRYEKGKPKGRFFDGLRMAIGNNGEAGCELRADLLRKVEIHKYFTALMQKYRAFIDSGENKLLEQEFSEQSPMPVQLNDSEGNLIQNGFYIIDILIPGSWIPLVFAGCENNRITGKSFDGLCRTIGTSGEAGCELRSDLLKKIDSGKYFNNMARKYRTFIDSRGSEIFEERFQRDF